MKFAERIAGWLPSAFRQSARTLRRATRFQQFEVEQLEPYLLLSFLVTNSRAQGAGSLAQAILDADKKGGGTIQFRIPQRGVVKISTSALPSLTARIVIDATTQPGYAGSPLITIQGAGESGVGLTIQPSALGSTVRGLTITGFANGIVVNNAGGNTFQANVVCRNAANGIVLNGAGASGNLVVGNSIGTDSMGKRAAANQGYGITVINGASKNTIGGTTAALRNLISGNGFSGIEILGNGTSGNLVIGNFIGTDNAGRAAIANALDGVVITNGATNNSVGGATAGARNLIGGNGFDGILISGSGTSGNLVAGNFLGANVTGKQSLANGASGLQLAAGASRNTVGGIAAGARNVISGNGYDGIQVHDADTVGNLIEGNLIGTDASGSSALANAGNGVEVFQGGAGTTIGGTSAGARNIISGNLEDGVTLRSGATSVLAQGNFIGTELSGSRALPNAGNGVNFYLGARGNTVGGAIAGARNVVSGNAEYGVSITDSATTGNVVSGNFVGTNAAGLSAVPNLMEGVVLLNSTSANTIGGTIAGAGNVISGNGKNGIVLTDHNTSKNVVAGNRVGTDLSSTHAVGNAANGIVLSNGASDNTIGGISSAAGNVISANSYSGVGLYDEETSGNVLQGNFIGTNPSGSRVLANGNNGVELTGGASNNTIGGTLSGAGNVISNNPYAGIAIGNRQTSGNLVQGNRIGTDPSGSVALPNEEGIHFYDGTSQNTIGGSTAAARNVISGNTDNGVDLHDAGTSRNLIEGNYIGTNANATAGVPNRGDGVLVVNLASANTIGGTVAGAGNTIAYNLGNGVAIGESRSESLTGIAVIGNSLFANQQIGIDLVDDGVTANTHGAPHSGPNRLQHFPVLTSAVVSAGAVTVEGTFQGASIAAVRVEFYVNPTSDRTGYGQGEFLLGATEITTDQTGNAKFIRTFTTEMLVTAGEFLTATATDPFGDTSEFSRQQKIV